MVYLIGLSRACAHSILYIYAGIYVGRKEKYLGIFLVDIAIMLNFVAINVYNNT